MKPRLRKLVLFLLLVFGGAIVNVAVAWVIKISDPATTNVVSIPAAEAVELSGRYLGVTWPLQRYIGFGYQHDMVAMGDSGPIFFVSRESLGWPCLSLFDISVFDERGIRSHGVLRNAAGESRAWLPLYPIWPGFAINTMFYAAILWMVFVAPFALRRRRRIKRGLCLVCAYPIGASETCTECGKPVSTKCVAPT